MTREDMRNAYIKAGYDIDPSGEIKSMRRISTPIPLTQPGMTDEQAWKLLSQEYDRVKGENILDTPMTDWHNAALAAIKRASQNTIPLTPSDEMVEAGGRAIFLHDHKPPKKQWDEIGPGFHHDNYRSRARACLTAALNLMGGNTK